MQDVRDSMTSGERGPVSPIKAFLVLGAVVAATIGAIIATRPDPPAATQQPNSASIPTEAEAIEIFRRLESRLDQAYEQRDVSLLAQIYEPGTSVSDIAARDIRQLRKDKVLVRTTADELSLEATDLSKKKIVLFQEVTLDARFVEEDGTELSSTSERQRVRWRLVLLEDGWRIRDAEVLEAST